MTAHRLLLCAHLPLLVYLLLSLFIFSSLELSSALLLGRYFRTGAHNSQQKLHWQMQTRLSAQKFDPSAFIQVSLNKPLGLSLEEFEPNKAKGVYIAGIAEGNAKASGKLNKGLYLIEVQGVDVKYQDFDSVIDLIAAVPAETPIDLVFIDPKSVLLGPAILSVTTPEGKNLKVKTIKGQRLRTVLLDSNIEVYSGSGKFTNCGGGMQCRTCVVNVKGDTFWEPRSEFEDRALKKYGPLARLSCNTIVEGDCEIEIRPEKSS